LPTAKQQLGRSLPKIDDAPESSFIKLAALVPVGGHDFNLEIDLRLVRALPQMKFHTYLQRAGCGYCGTSATLPQQRGVR
jgi:hypothetical protein